MAYSWYVSFLEWIRDTAHPWLGPLVAIGELTIGILLIVGLFAGIAAARGAVLNFSYVFAGSAGVNPAMTLVSVLLIPAWRKRRLVWVGPVDAAAAGYTVAGWGPARPASTHPTANRAGIAGRIG